MKLARSCNIFHGFQYLCNRGVPSRLFGLNLGLVLRSDFNEAQPNLYSCFHTKSKWAQAQLDWYVLEFCVRVLNCTFSFHCDLSYILCDLRSKFFFFGTVFENPLVSPQHFLAPVKSGIHFQYYGHSLYQFSDRKRHWPCWKSLRDAEHETVIKLVMGLEMILTYVDMLGTCMKLVVARKRDGRLVVREECRHIVEGLEGLC